MLRTTLFRTVLLLALSATSRRALVGQEPTHVVDKGIRSTGAVPPSELEARLQRIVHDYSDRRIMRVAVYDVAFPADSAEYVAVDGNALLLVVSIAEDPDDLPMTALYAVTDSGRQLLIPLSKRTYELPTGTYGTVLGRNRTDAFYLVPSSIWGRQAHLVGDFPKRSGFVLGPIGAPPEGTYPAQRPGQHPADAAVTALWTREFPGFTHP